MKKIFYILVLLAGMIFISCNNDDDTHCEQWEVQEWIKDGNTYLQQPKTSTKTLCDDDIRAKGTTYVWHENGSVKYYRKMIEKL